jgi:DNA polymerase I-like protein with 3'-5' exonuclease and polymerase domains
MKKPFVAIDFETSFFPKRKIGLKSMGVDEYLWHPEVEIYLVAVYSDILEEPYTGHPYDMDWGAIKDLDWVSHNAGFDRRVFRRLCHLRPEIAKCETRSWQCTANLSTWFGHPRDLKKACAAVFNSDISKDARKKMENKTYADLKNSSDWDEILAYAARDAYWCWRLWDELSGAWPQIEKDISDMTTRQVLRGLPCDKDYLERSIKKLERECWEAKNNIPWANGKSGEKAVLSPIALAEECRKINVAPPKSMAEDNPETQQWEAENLSIPWVKEMRRYRKANLLLTKLSTMKNRLRPFDGRFDFSQKYCGAHTKRTSGDQGFNVQGFQRDPYICGDNERVDMRRAIHSMHGGKLIIADLAQIEPRTLAWITNDRSKIELINKGVSVYEVHAIQTLGWSGGNLKKENPKMYALCKMRVLGLSYGCGWQRFIDYCWNQFGYELNDRDSKMQVNDFRRKERLIVGLWNQLQSKLENSTGQDLEIELPSWNVLKYRDIRKVKGQITATLATGRVNKIWGSLAVENIIQSTARDCFYEKLIQIENAGIPTLFSVHDEVITDEIPEDQQKDALEIVEEIMRGECSWMPGIALDSEIAVSPFYLK